MVELSVTLTAEEPNAVGPVARVVAHGEQKRDARRKEIADEGDDESHGYDDDGDRKCHLRDAHRSVRVEEKEPAIEHDDVPLEGPPHGNVAHDEPVKHQHEHQPHERDGSTIPGEQDDRYSQLEQRTGMSSDGGEP